jgi:hypothetical protein
VHFGVLLRHAVPQLNGGRTNHAISTRHAACSRLRVSRAFAVLLWALSPLLASAAHAQPTAPATSSPIESASRGTELLWPAHPPEGVLSQPILRRGRDMGLISVGIVGLSVGMIVGIGIASADLAGGNCHNFFGGVAIQCGTAAFSLIPFAGTVIVGNVGLHGSIDDGLIHTFGTLGLAPQIFGIIFLLVGMHGFTEDLGSRDDDFAVQVLPIVSSSQLGLRVSVSL